MSNLAVGTSGGGKTVEKVVIGKGYLNPDTDTLEDVEAPIAVLQGASGVQTKWARQIPPPAPIGTIIDSYPTDADPNFRFHLTGPNPSFYTFTQTLTITRVSTGTHVFESSAGVLASGGPGEQYNFVTNTQLTADLSLPSGFQDIGDPSEVVDNSPGDTYTDPRDIT